MRKGQSNPGRNGIGAVGRLSRAQDALHESEAQALRALVKATPGAGEQFFRSLVVELARLLGVNHALLGVQLPGTPERVRTLARWSCGALVDNLDYELAGSPCANVVGKRLCYYPSGVQELFPHDPMLAQAGVVSYLGIPLFSSSGAPLGILCVMDDRPMPDAELAQSLMTLFAGRAASEMERFQALAQRQRAEALLAGEKRVLEWLAQRRPLPEVLQELCRFIEGLSPGMMSSILLLQPDGSTLRPIAGPSLPAEWTRAITPLPIGPSVGACGTAAWGKTQVVASDIATDPRWTSYPELCALALKCGLRACWSTPILAADGQVLGTFAMYYRQPRSPTPADLDLIHQVTHLAGIAIEHDRTAEDLRLAKEQAEQREQILTAMMEHIPLGIAIADAPDVALRAISRYGLQTTDEVPEQVRGLPAELHTQHWHIFRSDGVTPATSAELPLTRATQKGEFVHSEEWVVQRPNGLKIPILATAAPIRDTQGRLIGGVVGWQDISQLKDAQQALQLTKEELARSNARLEDNVRERTAKLQEALAELEHMSYSMVHDMRAPLRAMHSFATMAERACTAGSLDRAQDYFRIIRESASRLDQLITDALNYKKMLRQQLPARPTDLALLLRTMLDTYPNLHPDLADVHLEFDHLCVLANESLLTQCFGNLLANAVKFVAPGTRPRVRIWAQLSTLNQARPGRAAELSGPSPPSTIIWVEDNGIGIPKDAQQTIFHLFQRLHSQYPGTGIGLAIVAKAVERMGGRVGVRSEPGQGSCFWVELPSADFGAWGVECS